MRQTDENGTEKRALAEAVAAVWERLPPDARRAVLEAVGDAAFGRGEDATSAEMRVRAYLDQHGGGALPGPGGFYRRRAQADAEMRIAQQRAENAKRVLRGLGALRA